MDDESNLRVSSRVSIYCSETCGRRRGKRNEASSPSFVSFDSDSFNPKLLQRPSQASSETTNLPNARDTLANRGRSATGREAMMRR